MATAKELQSVIDELKSDLKKAKSNKSSGVPSSVLAEMVSTAVGGAEGNKEASRKFCSHAIEALKNTDVQKEIARILFKAVIEKISSDI